MKRMDSRCLLREGHQTPHAFPNYLAKKEDPELFKALQGEEIPSDELVDQLGALELE